MLAARSAPVGASRNPGLLVRGNGTSFATPHVTGAVALCFEAAGARLSAREIRSLVLGSCDPVPDADPECRLGHGYLNIPRLVADVRQALAAPASAPDAKEPTMATEDTIVLLAAAPATAYREYLYRPRGRFARWIGDRFDVVARPGQPIDRAPQRGDVLLEVTLGRTEPGPVRHARRRVTSQRRGRGAKAGPGQLLLRPRKARGDVRTAARRAGPGDLAFMIPGTAGSEGAESGAAGESSPGQPGPPGQVAAGRLIVDQVPLLRSHAGTPPDMVLSWNAHESAGTVDVVVHLHGFSARGPVDAIAGRHRPGERPRLHRPAGPLFSGPDQPDPAGLASR